MSTPRSPDETGKITAVLIVDDNPDDLDFWSAALRRTSPRYSIFKAETPKAALDLYNEGKIDCIVLDLDLTDGSGFEVLLTVVPDRKQPTTPVVVLTRLVNPALKELVLEHGARGYLIKANTSPEQLHESIQKATGSMAI